MKDKCICCNTNNKSCGSDYCGNCIDNGNYISLNNKLIKNLAEYIELMLEVYNSNPHNILKLSKQDVINHLSRKKEL